MVETAAENVPKYHKFHDEQMGFPVLCICSKIMLQPMYCDLLKLNKSQYFALSDHGGEKIIPRSANVLKKNKVSGH